MTGQPDNETLVETVLRCLNNPVVPNIYDTDARAALDTLAAHLADAEARAEAAERRVAALEAALERTQTISWWRHEVDVNGEYTTTDWRNPYEMQRELGEALAEAEEQPDTPQEDGESDP